MNQTELQALLDRKTEIRVGLDDYSASYGSVVIMAKTLLDALGFLEAELAGVRKDCIELAIRECNASADLAARDVEIARLRDAYSRQNAEVCQTLGKVLGYPWYKDDQKNFPGAVEADGVCEGEHVAESIAAEAANKIKDMQVEIAALRRAVEDLAAAKNMSELEDRVEFHAATIAHALEGK